MKKIYIGIVSIALLFAYGCSDFLDVESRERVEAGDSEDIYEPEQFVDATYGMFTDWSYAFSYLGITEILSDNADKGSSPTDTGSGKDLLDAVTYTSTSGEIEQMWGHWYKSIGRASQAIEYTVNYAMTDETYRNRLIGEAKFLRALNYFFLVRGWGDVPIQAQDLTVRAPKAEVYAYIEQDLKDAMASLPVRYDAANIGRATKGAAQGLLSKVYLYQGKWQEAYDNANEVITSSEYGYDLMPDYRDIWKVTGENKEESLFEFQARGEAPAHGIQQYSETQGARGETGWGWGFNTPSEDLLEAFEAEGDDIRKEATIIFRNSTLYDGRVIGNTENPMYNMKAYSSANLASADGDKNIRYLRLGEIYLIRAEAANELGNTTQALADLNKVRNRVKLADVTTTNQDELRKAIWHERRLELAFEHDRWFDLNRTGEAEAVMKAVGKPYVKGKHELFPIPNQQLIEIPDLGQNPGW